ncbi:MAG: hypothetical protein ABI723_10235 [Bacteroidia bacterium]
MNSKEKLIEETLQSIENIKRATVSPELYELVMERLKNQKARIVSIKSQTMWRAAACIAVLVGLNIFTLIQNKKSDSTPPDNSNSFAQEYFSYLKEN